VSRPVRPVMSWDACEPTDADCRVVWWTRLPGDELAEVRHTAPYRGRLRRWADRGRGPLLQDDPVRLPRDVRAAPGPDQVAEWRRALDPLSSPGRRPGPAGGSVTA
jgi:hypothetical protein